MKVKIAQLRTLIQKVLTASRYSMTQAKEIAEVLLYAEMTGKNTQGIIKFFGTEPIHNIIPHHKPKIIKSTKASAFIDGGRNPGMLVARMATKIAIDKCKRNGFAIVGTNNSFSSTGAIGFYANEIAKNNIIGVIMSGTPKGVAPYGSIDKLLGINPIAFGFPTDNDPLIFDMATAAITWYGLVRAKIMGQKLPIGVAVDSLGNPTNDPEKAMKGAVLTFGENPKMSGISMMVEMFTGPLVGAILPDTDGKWYNGNFFVAIDPDLFIGRNAFKENSSFLINKIKKSRPKKGSKEVFIPGEKALKARKKAEASGVVEIDDAVYRDFLHLVGKYKQ